MRLPAEPIGVVRQDGDVNTGHRGEKTIAGAEEDAVFVGKSGLDGKGTSEHLGHAAGEFAGRGGQSRRVAESDNRRRQ
jgi:hypothetical protein